MRNLLSWLWCSAAVMLGLCASVQGRSDNQTQAWQPEAIDAQAFRDIVDYNIFEADRASIAKRADALRNPPPTPKPVAATPPQHPDFDFILVGVTLRGDDHLAYIENRREDHRVIQVNVPSDFSEGRITSANADGVVYRVGDVDRVIKVGFSLKGDAIPLEPVTPKKIFETQPDPSPSATEHRAEPPTRWDRRDRDGFRGRRERN